ncbi:hypothetical protein amb2102 [Paramagnetospirillum magneticum AMB-1]|uniref:Uncharacterized protein n=1 Tax=Paramagnetospirillum magneticum (strain ATCC 700264 / AMB-1) TaxID=342108 RepID=Q2W5G9_PARM1|nr:hypothetical protein amb2102 [Paramagnetospirillum magneticum AMB-1]
MTVRAATTARIVRAVTVNPAVWKEANNDRGQDRASPPRRRRWRSPASSVLPPPQDLPVLGRGCAEDRLQGHQAAVSVHFRAWQDRPVAHHRGVRQEAA